MSITYFPFDAVVDSDGNYDRTYTSEQFALYFSKLFSNGVYGADSTGLQVTALNGNMYITVAAGAFSSTADSMPMMRTKISCLQQVISTTADMTEWWQERTL